MSTATNETAMVDAAMVEMKNIHPPLRRSDCARLIHAALGAALDAPTDPKRRIERIGLLRAALRTCATSGDLVAPIAQAALDEDDTRQESAAGVPAPTPDGGQR